MSDTESASHMTMRDYFAGEVLSGAMSRQRIPKDTLDEWAQYAYRAADAMLKVRNGGNGAAAEVNEWDEVDK